MSKLEALARELCRIRYPDPKREGQCVYVWESMSEDHQQMFLDSARCAIRFAIEELEDLHDLHTTNRSIDELRKISA